MALLITPEALAASLTDNLVFDRGLAEWAIGVVSDTARDIAGRPEWEPDTCPAAVLAIIGLAARRLYTNPDRMTRENDGDYGYALDSSVTDAAVFTPSEQGRLRRFAPGAAAGGLRVVSTTRGDAAAPSGLGERSPRGWW
ncbi:hypothetical protein CSPHI_05000 [Corynebacterium sphenisci DSM 44792]|uniref:Uncharacterized protein n=1 Tax=Corynebacterium sphenisci DSM 44792 TaxID=1437874 RepID=A0A1L7CX99_9CORY|nr:hypothetical protein [Corynebacterium sphenisci]APT90499.1 hypothetical protein CSPHI_05000 [Corynebacterium sphenisci DSM 44792]